MTTIADLLARDLSGLAREPAEYIATNHIQAEYEGLFSAMTAALKSPDEAVGIWISGPPGSGKSSFVKNLAYQRAEFFNRSIPYQIFLVNLRAELAVEAHAEHIACLLYTSRCV